MSSSSRERLRCRSISIFATRAFIRARWCSSRSLTSGSSTSSTGAASRRRRAARVRVRCGPIDHPEHSTGKQRHEAHERYRKLCRAARVLCRLRPRHGCRREEKADFPSRSDPRGRELSSPNWCLRRAANPSRTRSRASRTNHWRRATSSSAPTRGAGPGTGSRCPTSLEPSARRRTRSAPTSTSSAGPAVRGSTQRHLHVRHGRGAHVLRRVPRQHHVHGAGRFVLLVDARG